MCGVEWFVFVCFSELLLLSNREREKQNVVRYLYLFEAVSIGVKCTI